jgi:cytochrome c-type biogenesis protein CcmH
MARHLAFVLVLLLPAGCHKEQVPSPPPPGAAKPAIDVSSLPAPPAGEITGTIEVASAVADKVKPGDTIYVIARNAATNAAVAVVKLTAPDRFPIAFTLSGSHTMTPGSGLYGKVKLQARVDKDGDAMTKNPGDVVGEVPDLVEVPKSGVVLTLDKVL